MTIAIMISIISVVITLIFNSFVLYFNFKNSNRTDTKDFAETVKNTARINVMLEMISNTTQEIKSEIVNMRKEIQTHDSRLAKVEESVRYAHKRIEELDKRIDELEG